MSQLIPAEKSGLGCCIVAACGSASLLANSKPKKAPIAQMDESKRALHALNRLTFGPRPGDVEKVTAMGVDKWIDLQLNPQKIDDSALQARLQNFRTLNMDARYAGPGISSAASYQSRGRWSPSNASDPAERAIYQSRN